MKIKMIASELVDGEIDFVSLVKHGANRSPWKIVKAENKPAGPQGPFAESIELLNQAFAKTQALAKQGNKSLEKSMKMKDIGSALAEAGQSGKKSDADNSVDKVAIAKLQNRLAILNERLHKIWERPDTPISARLENDTLYAIEKCEILLQESGYVEPDIVNQGSAFFYRGGSSTYLIEEVASDSAFSGTRSREIHKAEQSIDLSTPIATTDVDAVHDVDLSSLKI